MPACGLPRVPLLLQPTEGLAGSEGLVPWAGGSEEGAPRHGLLHVRDAGVASTPGLGQPGKPGRSGGCSSAHMSL